MRWYLIALCLLMLAGCSDEDRGGHDAADVDAPETLEECGDFQEGTNLHVCTATYLGASEGAAVAADIDAQGRQWVGGNFEEAPVALQEWGSGQAMILQLNPTGGELLGGHRLDGDLVDMALDTGTDAMAVATDGAVGLIDQDELLWEHAVDGVGRVDIDGSRVVALIGDEVRLLDEGGATSFKHDIERSAVRDVAIDAATERVFVTGYDQVSGDLQQPFLLAYDFDGERAWTGWDWSSDEAGDLSSDTRGAAVSMGLDGYLYYVGESHGGVTTHFRMPDDIDEEAPLVRRDAYSESHNWNGAAPLGFVARLSPETGELKKGQLMAVRLSDGRGNAVSPRAIAADEDGTMILSGDSACCIEDWEERRVADQAVMPDYGGGAWAMVLTPAFDARPVWTTFGNPDASVDIADVATRGGAMTVIQNQTAGSDHDAVRGQLVTHAALQSTPPGAQSSPHLTVFPAP